MFSWRLIKFFFSIRNFHLKRDSSNLTCSIMETQYYNPNLFYPLPQHQESLKIFLSSPKKLGEKNSWQNWILYAVREHKVSRRALRNDAAWNSMENTHPEIPRNPYCILCGQKEYATSFRAPKTNPKIPAGLKKED